MQGLLSQANMGGASMRARGAPHLAAMVRQVSIHRICRYEAFIPKPSTGPQMGMLMGAMVRPGYAKHNRRAVSIIGGGIII